MVIMNKQKNSKKIVNIAWIYSITGFHTDFSYKSLEKTGNCFKKH